MMQPNRVVLVDEGGRQYDRTGVEVHVDTQDEGLTLKIFVRPLPADEHSRANARHLTRLSADLKLHG